MTQFELVNGKEYGTRLTNEEFLELIEGDKQFIALDVYYTLSSDNYHRDYDPVIDEKIVINKNHILKINIY